MFSAHINNNRDLTQTVSCDNLTMLTTHELASSLPDHWLDHMHWYSYSWNVHKHTFPSPDVKSVIQNFSKVK
jgi:hypothetical protein